MTNQNTNDLIEDLAEKAKRLKSDVSLTKNVGIKNRQEEKQRFLEARENNEKFRPEFNFRSEKGELESVKQEIEELQERSGEIRKEDIEIYGPENLEAEDFQDFFKELFRELRLYAELLENIEEFEEWKKTCLEIWELPEEERIEDSRTEAKRIKPERSEESLDAGEVKKMFESEFERLGVDYEVEIREVSGCFNIPEEQKLIVASGDGEERRFSQKEAEMLTMHETFHSIRAYNGAKAGEKSGFPDILGVHTPFYDQTEEGGAIYREHMTGTSYAVKEKKYHLMRIAAYEVSQADNFVEEFEEITDTLIEHGASPEQAFSLAARNREVLRHQIYRTGYEQWQRMENREKMLIGKLSQEWAERFWKEAEAGGMLQKPEISADQLFEFSFKD